MRPAGTAPELRSMPGYASARLLQGRFDEAQQSTEAAVSAAEAAGDRRLQARGLHLLDRIHAAAGTIERALYYRDAALPIFAELDALAAQGTALHDLAADARSRAGDVVRAAATINSLGQAEQELGMLDSAEQRYTEALRNWRGARSPRGSPRPRSCFRPGVCRLVCTLEVVPAGEASQ